MEVKLFPQLQIYAKHDALRHKRTTRILSCQGLRNFPRRFLASHFHSTPHSFCLRLIKTAEKGKLRYEFLAKKKQLFNGARFVAGYRKLFMMLLKDLKCHKSHMSRMKSLQMLL
ncbi:CLUMA_CG016665, isoform A [Clunio marinus]|uniref:CLUMA_CG016665, isoform A n=1 Tax=Clunio marinus TaxID=568069 RepID=A0A1J1IYM5_9DIPT|nr:CLUMA_CG016665, isoform A [Clunio marinus]